MTSIKEIMKKDFPKLSSSESVESAVELMEKRGIDYLLAEEKDEIRGVVTSHGLVGYPPSRLIMDCVIEPVGTIPGETLLDEALKILEEKKANFLVILNKKGVAIGVVNREIIISFLYQELKKSNKEKEEHITKLKKVEGELQNAEKDWHDSFNSLEDVMLVIDRDYNIEDINGAGLKLLKKSKERVIGKKCYQIIDGTDSPNEECPCRRSLKTKKVESLDRYEERFGRYFSIKSSPMFDGNGKIIKFVDLRRDITERKKAEEALKESEEKCRNLFENAVDPIIILSKRGKFIKINKKVEEVLGYKKENLIGKKSTEVGILTEKSKLIAFQKFIKRMDGFDIEPYEIEVIKKNGEMIIGEINASPVKHDGKIIGDMIIIRDITERKKAEEQIRASLKEKEVLLREIHHRVKNNIQVISSLLRMQSRNLKDKQAVDVLRECQDRIRSMALIHEKFYGSRDLSNIDFREYTKELVDDLSQSYGIDTDKIALKIDVENIPLEINSAIPCGLLLNELVSNSLKHAFPGGNSGEIKISLRATDGDEIELKVSDNGVGIPPELDFRDTESLGLQLVTTLVEDQLEGKIELDRVAGTEFKIIFKKMPHEGKS